MSRRRNPSKFLSLVLRHRPERAKVRPDAAGWVLVDDLLRGVRWLSRERLEEVVATNNKQRFELSGDGTRIRARQGHSIDVDLGYRPLEAPEHLWHGTATRFREGIEAEGLRPMSRHAVHMSPDEVTASAVGRRHGELLMLRVRAREHQEATGARYYRTGNDVWLTDEVPLEFIDFP